MVPAKYNLFAKSKQGVMILDEELFKQKKLFAFYLELMHRQNKLYGMFLGIQINVLFIFSLSLHINIM